MASLSRTHHSSPSVYVPCPEVSPFRKQVAQAITVTIHGSKHHRRHSLIVRGIRVGPPLQQQQNTRGVTCVSSTRQGSAAVGTSHLHIHPGIKQLFQAFRMAAFGREHRSSHSETVAAIGVLMTASHLIE